jgi:putative transposase
MMSSLQRAYKTELDLNHAQITACKQHAGAARWAYNWGLQRKQDAYRMTGVSPSAVDLHRELNALKKTEVSWMYAVSKCAPQEALRNLDTAFANFFRRAKLKQHGQWRGKVGYPHRKTRKQGLGSFRLTGTIVVFPDGIQLPRLGRLRLKERGYLPTAAAGTADAHTHILSATVSEEAGHWYVSLLVEVEQRPVIPENAESSGHTGPIVGVDLGVKALATLSDGTVIPNPRPLKRQIKQLKRLQRVVSRKHKGSQNRKKAVRRLARLHRRIAHQRANTLHQLTSRLAKTKSVVVVEDLNVAGMLKNHHLAQAIADVGFGEFRRQLTYKAGWYGCRVVVVSRWEPSSKTCSGCGAVKAELALAERVYHCDACGLMLDRDLNAAMNLSKLAKLA